MSLAGPYRFKEADDCQHWKGLLEEWREYAQSYTGMTPSYLHANLPVCLPLLYSQKLKIQTTTPTRTKIASVVRHL